MVPYKGTSSSSTSPIDTAYTARSDKHSRLVTGPKLMHSHAFLRHTPEGDMVARL